MSFNLDGNSGIGHGQMSAPSGVAVDTAGNIYVADTANNQIEEFTSLGLFVRALTAGGSTASAPGFAMNHPSGVAVDSSGNIYVADTGNNQVEKLSPDGTLLATFSAAGFVPGGGSAARKMKSPAAVAIDATGDIFVADRGDNQIVELSSTGTFLKAFTATGLGSGPQAVMNGPSGVALDANGNIYVADTGNSQIEELSPGGSLRATFTASGMVPAPGGTVAKLRGPLGVTVDATGNVYISDTGDNQIVGPTGSRLASNT